MRLRYGFLVVGLLASLACVARSDQTPADPQMAVERARQGLGLAGDGRASAVAQRLDAATLPFLSAQLQGNEVWRVDFTEPRWPSLELPRVRSISVLLAPDGDVILKVTSPSPDGEPSIAPFPSAAVEERQLTAQEERFTRPASSSARLTLAEALAIVARNAANFSETRQIIAYHVERTTVRHGARTVWIIQLRGMRPFGAAGPGVPEDARNHLRHVVDAKTGEWLGADSLPQPEAP